MKSEVRMGFININTSLLIIKLFPTRVKMVVMGKWVWGMGAFVMILIIILQIENCYFCFFNVSKKQAQGSHYRLWLTWKCCVWLSPRGCQGDTDPSPRAVRMTRVTVRRSQTGLSLRPLWRASQRLTPAPVPASTPLTPWLLSS